MEYYSVQKHFEKLFDRTERSHSFSAGTVEEYEIWSRSLREKLRELLGMQYMEECPLQEQVLAEEACEGYIRRKILLHTEEDVVMPVFVLIPDDVRPGDKRTAVIACHGHMSDGKNSVAGIRKIPAVSKYMDEFRYSYGEDLVRMGYIVLIPDARGAGERREQNEQGEDPEKILSSSCSYLNSIAVSLGQTVLGMWIWDLMRLTDHALGCEWSNGHIACTGFSGGGLQSLWLGALDTRIECCAVSGYFYGSRQALLSMENCWCNYVPGLWRTADMGDIGALIAPRPLLLETGDQDPLNGAGGLDNVLPQVGTVRRAMKLFGAEHCLYHDIVPGGHRWNGSAAYKWLASHVPAITGSVS